MRKIEEIKNTLLKNSSLNGAIQEHIIFPTFTLGKLKELEGVLFQNFGVSGKRNVIGLAVMFLLEELKTKTEKDGK